MSCTCLAGLYSLENCCMCNVTKVLALHAALSFPLCLTLALRCQTRVVCLAGAVQLQAQRAASALGVSHTGLPRQVLLPSHGHHEQAGLCCHPDPLPFEACPGLCLLQTPGTNALQPYEMSWVALFTCCFTGCAGCVFVCIMFSTVNV